MPEFYTIKDRVPEPCPDLHAWMDWIIENPDYRDVRYTEMYGGLRVSTIFVGIDMNHMGRVMDDGSPPLLFETALVTDGGAEIYDRCATWDEAQAMHDEAVQEAAERLRDADAMINLREDTASPPPSGGKDQP